MSERIEKIKHPVVFFIGSKSFVKLVFDNNAVYLCDKGNASNTNV